MHGTYLLLWASREARQLHIACSIPTGFCSRMGGPHQRSSEQIQRDWLTCCGDRTENPAGTEQEKPVSVQYILALVEPLFKST